MNSRVSVSSSSMCLSDINLNSFSFRAFSYSWEVNIDRGVIMTSEISSVR